MVRQVVDLWVQNGQAQGLVHSAEEMEVVHFKQAPLQQTVATWKPTSGPTILTLS